MSVDFEALVCQTQIEPNSTQRTSLRNVVKNIITDRETLKNMFNQTFGVFDSVKGTLLSNLKDLKEYQDGFDKSDGWYWRPTTWNLANNKKYTEALNAGIMPPKEIETLSETQKFNEYILTRLRTHWGVDPNDMSEPFKSTFLEEVKEFIPDMIFESDGKYFLTTQGKMWADHISSQLFASEE